MDLYHSQSELDYDGWLQLRLYHALNNDPVPHFTDRGNITVTSIRSGASTIGQMGLEASQLERLKILAENDRKYRLKIVTRSSAGSETTFLTSVPAVLLIIHHLLFIVYELYFILRFINSVI